MIEVRRTEVFARWIGGLRDDRGAAKIAVRIKRIGQGNFGDCKPVGEGVSEMRIPFGPGYCVYFVQRGSVVIVLLCGGDKSSQARDIARAKAMAKELE
jgi:putative addiction module killer protein